MGPNDGTVNVFQDVSPTVDLQSWTHLASEAKSGRLVLDPEIAKECADACEVLISGIDDLRGSIQRLGSVVGLGDYECGKQLAAALVDIAFGKDGFDQRLSEHIEVVKLIHDTVGAQVAKMLSKDDETAQSLGGTSAGLGG